MHLKHYSESHDEQLAGQAVGKPSTMWNPDEGFVQTGVWWFKKLNSSQFLNKQAFVTVSTVI